MNDPAASPLMGDAGHELRREYYARTQQHFAQALLVAPDQENLRQGSLSPSVWPLILQECPGLPDDVPCEAAFGSILLADGLARVEMGQPTVYAVSRPWVREGRPGREMSFIWFLPSEDDKQMIRYRGYRVLMDENGRGLIWNLLENGSPMQSFFISEPVEVEVRLSGRTPLPERLYAVEPGVETKPNLVVARLLSEEPVPMGPFVYLDQPHTQVSTLLCRCMETQVDAIVKEMKYRRLELSSWSELFQGHDLPANLELPEEIDNWWELLRLPENF